MKIMKKILAVIALVAFTVVTGCATVPLPPNATTVQKDLAQAQAVLDGIGIGLDFAPAAVTAFCAIDKNPADCVKAKQILADSQAAFKVAQDLVTAAQLAGTDPLTAAAWGQALTALTVDIKDINALLDQFGISTLPATPPQAAKAKASLQKLKIQKPHRTKVVCVGC